METYLSHYADSGVGGGWAVGAREHVEDTMFSKICDILLFIFNQIKLWLIDICLSEKEEKKSRHPDF